MPPPRPDLDVSDAAGHRFRAASTRGADAIAASLPFQPDRCLGLKCKGGDRFFLAMAHVHRRVLSRWPATAQATYTRAPITTPSN